MNINSIIKKVLKEESRSGRYMFFSNLEQMKRQCEILLEKDEDEINSILENGHDWAQDHIAEAKNNMDQVFDFLMNEFEGEDSDVMLENEITEKKKKNTPTNPELWKKSLAWARARYDVCPSAYCNGAAAKRYKSKGGKWKKKPKNESDETLMEDLKRWFKEKWVDVSKKVGGKHPPCGRKDANGKSYPKCRPSKKVSKETPKVASSYDKEEKKSMTQQKRRAEKKEPKIGKGNKPTMTHYEK